MKEPLTQAKYGLQINSDLIVKIFTMGLIESLLGRAPSNPCRKNDTVCIATPKISQNIALVSKAWAILTLVAVSLVKS
ncbi:hypothetical protein MA617_004469 [Vibrio vulnificus]|nr:hypothetical protein [Vibrio vulnificus]